MTCVVQRSTSVSICITCPCQLSTWGTATVASTMQASLLMTRSALALQMQRSHLVMWVPSEQCSCLISTARFISQYRLNSAAQWVALPGLWGQSIKKLNFLNSEPTGVRSMLAMVALCSGDFKLYSDISSITPCQLVIKPQPFEWVCV